MIDSVILIWLWSKVYTLQSNINYRPLGCLRSPGTANTVGILTMHHVQSVICWSFKNNINSITMRNSTTVIYDKSTKSSYSSKSLSYKEQSNFCVKMTKMQRLFSVLLKCMQVVQNELILPALQASYWKNVMLMMWLTLVKWPWFGVMTHLNVMSIHCELYVRIFKIIWTRHKMPGWWCDCDLGQITLGRTGTSLCHEQILCKVWISDISFNIVQ